YICHISNIILFTMTDTEDNKSGQNNSPVYVVEEILNKPRLTAHGNQRRTCIVLNLLKRLRKA
ncbi:hypothetical protein D917_10224, partial [Trichinella nativa]